MGETARWFAVAPLLAALAGHYRLVSLADATADDILRTPRQVVPLAGQGRFYEPPLWMLNAALSSGSARHHHHIHMRSGLVTLERRWDDGVDTTYSFYL